MGRAVKKTSTSQATSKTFTIPNKLHRQSYNVRLKSALASQKRKERHERKKEESRDPKLKEERLRKNIPATLERKRVWDERVEGAFPDETEEAGRKEVEVKRRKKNSKRKSEDSDKGSDSENSDSENSQDSDEEPEAPPEETLEQLESKRLTAREKEQATKAESEETSTLFPTLNTPPTIAMPKILITTNRNCHIHKPAEQLTELFPNATYIPRGRKFSIKEICTFASKPSTIDESTGKQREPFTHVVVINEDRKIVNALTIVVLPEGPTFHFSMTNYKPPTRIRGHGNPTNHIPELILNNFLTPLGRVTASLFQSMFPRQPEFKGRQVVTLHNQRDYIFLRRHRYVFRERRTGEKPVGYGLEDMGNDGGNGSKGDESIPVKVGLQELGPQFTIKLRRVERGIKEGVEWEWKARMEKDRKKFNL